MQRRDLLKLSSLALVGMSVAPSLMAEKKRKNKTDETLYLNFNENSLGMAEKAKQAIINSLAVGSRYPDDQRAELITQLAKKYDVQDHFISLGNGSSENIQAIVQWLVHKARQAKQAVQLIVPEPTFDYTELYARFLNVPVAKVPLTADFSFDLAKLQETAEQFSGLNIFLFM